MTFEKLNELLGQPLYEHGKQEKSSLFMDAVLEVTRHHYANCTPYRNLCNKRDFDPEQLETLVGLPYLPTALFKQTMLLSVEEDQVFREINSSATSSGMPSRMGLDRQTSRRQTKCFNKMVMNRIGTARYNFIVLDEASVVDRSQKVSARSSTLRSLMISAKSVDTCIDMVNDKLTLDEEKLQSLLEKYDGQKDEVLIFGFTFILYHYLVRPLLDAGKKFNFPGAKVVHIGGWKKLEAEKVTPEKLVSDACEVFGVDKRDVIDFYGFTEQAGLIYPTCEMGLRHMPVWADLLVRDPVTLEALPTGREGLLQFITPIQTSYPGHSVLTEDVGMVLGEDDCACGRMGKTFKIVGRAANAEVRGCGDIMADKFA